MVIQPEGTTGTVSKIVIGNDKVQKAVAGSCIQFTIKNIQRGYFEEIKAGMVVSGVTHTSPLVNSFRIKGAAYEHISRPLLNKQRVLVYNHN